jgi:hypothetical protein
MKKFIFILIFCLYHFVNGIGQVVSSGKVPVLINNKPKQEVSQNLATVPEKKSSGLSVIAPDLAVGSGKFYALIIGINDYGDPLINNLDYCIRDAGLFYTTIINKYTFEPENVKLINNATYGDIVKALDYFAKVVTQNDNFLIFYAGHGYWNETSQIGFWLPNDAEKNSTRNWFRNSTLRDYLREINSKHTLLIADACFGGAIFKSRAAFNDASVAVNKLYELPSRKAMTSGTLTTVPDQSSFTKYLVDRLKNNTDKYLPAEQLFSNFRIAVINNSNVVPQFGVVQDVGDEGGDFIFILR